MSRTVVVEHVSKSYRLRQNRPSLAEDAWRFVTRTSQPLPVRWVLRNVSFTLEAGTSLGVIGRNGAGKSTLLKILAGITHPTSGIVRVPLRVSAQFALGVGFNPFLTGLENTFLQGTMLGLTNRDVNRLLPAIEAFAELGEAMRRPLWTYSTGMSARLAFAIAAQAHAELLLIDEALGGGDAAFQERCKRALDEARAGGLALVVVSHSASAIRSLCDQTLWLDGGTVRTIGATGPVVDEYLREVKESPASR